MNYFDTTNINYLSNILDAESTAKTKTVNPDQMASELGSSLIWIYAGWKREQILVQEDINICLNFHIAQHRNK